MVNAHRCSICLLAVTLLAWGIPQASGQERLFVNQAVPASGDGQSWENAYQDLQQALLVAGNLQGTVQEIWIAAGAYKPTDGGDQAVAFVLVDGVDLYGGFAGNETSVTQRDPAVNVTILSGDLNGDDDNGFSPTSDCCGARAGAGCQNTACRDMVCQVDAFCCIDTWDQNCADQAICLCNGLCSNHCDNSFQVLEAEGLSSETIVDGFTIRGGHAFAPGTELNDRDGGGVRSIDSNLVLRRIVFDDNGAAVNGGSVFVKGGTVRIDDSTFTRSSARVGGGGVYLADTAAIITRAAFVENEAQRGGGLAMEVIDTTDVQADVVSCRLLGNEAADGGGVHVGNGSIRIMNTLFASNSASAVGGGLRSTASATVINSTFAFNDATRGGGVSVFGTGTNVFANSILWGNTDSNSEGSEFAQLDYPGNDGDVNYCIIDDLTGLITGTALSSSDPLFDDPDGVDGTPGTMDDDFDLGPGSPAVDAGDNTAVPADVADLDRDGDTDEPTPHDGNGSRRFLDDNTVTDTGVGPPPVVDLGAFEQNDCNDNGIPDEREVAEGSADDCNDNLIPDECEITSPELDCNGNSIPDSCDVAEGGGSDDFNQDGIPDECQDCQPNGLADSIDIAINLSDDCNLNGIPDECDARDGPSLDCQGDQIPDECQTADNDCDDNGVPDECDILSGDDDCNLNGLPDACEPDFDGDGVTDDCDEDVDGDGLNNDLDACNDTPAGSLVTPDGSIRGDSDADCDIDLFDFLIFNACHQISGPDKMPLLDECVELFDIDGDADIDFRDLVRFQRRFQPQSPG